MRRLRFGDFVLDTAGQRLLRDGREIPLPPKAYAVLALLVSHAGEVVTRDHLLDEVWAGTHVLDGAVKVCISDVRRALGETAARPRHLHTVQRRGYRFAGPVTLESRSAEGATPCAACGADMSASAEFCSRCGERKPFAVAAPRVSRASSPASASPVRRARAGVASAPSASPAVRAPPGERKQLTVVFAELAGLGRLRGALPASELESLLDGCQQSFAAIVRSLGGGIAQALPDGLVVYFGYPISYEDDAHRAVRLALRLQERTPALAARFERELAAAGVDPLRLEIGVHTGSVDLVGGGEGSEIELGHTVKLAARVEALAGPGDTLVSESTRRLVRGAFLVEDTGERVSDAEAEPLPVHRALRATGVQSRLEMTDADRLTEMVGREQEIALLLDRWETAKSGHGQGVLLSGDAGMGKSRLVHRLREQLAEEAHAWIELRGSALHRNSAFHPVIELLRQALHLTPEDSPEEQVARVERELETAGLPVRESLPLFAELLALPLPIDHPPSELSPELQRRRTLEALCAWLFALAERQPLCFVAEDLHWCDPSTLEFLGMWLEQSAVYPLLSVLTTRPDFELAWPAHAHLAALPLTGLSRQQVEAMLAHLAGGRSLPLRVRDHVHERSDGVPLFVEELTASLLESELLVEGDGAFERTDPLPSVAVPSTLQDTLEARLDRLGPAKELAQLASALGREFEHVLLAAIVPVDEDALASMLDDLVGAGLWYRRGIAPRARYAFKHALLQETAYRSLLDATRAEVHGRIADALEARFPERLDAQPESLARHYEEAGRSEAALSAYERAGRRAASRSENREAVAHLRDAMRLLGALPAGAVRDQRELRLQVAIGTPLLASLGSGAAEVEAAYARARDLSQQLGETTTLAEALVGMVTFFITQSRLDEALEVSEQQLELAERLGRVEYEMSAHYCAALVQLFRGDPRRAVRHFEAVAERFDPVVHRNLEAVRGENLGAVSRAWSTWAYWLCGRPVRAQQVAREALATAKQASHPFSEAVALAWSAPLYLFLDERETALALSNAAIEISRERGFPIPLGLARLVSLRCDHAHLSNDEGIAEAEQVLGELAATGTQVAVPQILWGFADFCFECDSPERAAGYVQAALAVAERTGQPYWDAELLRLQAEIELLRDGGGADEAERLLRRALEVAAGQGAAMLALRAGVSLARLLAAQGRAEEARAALAPRYAALGEAQDGVDGRRARELLDALA